MSEKTPSLVVPVLTPLSEGKFDAEVFDEIVEGIRDQVDEIVILGTTGGGHEHPMEICEAVLLHCVKYQGEIAIRVGIIRETTDESLALIQRASELGYEDFMVGAPEEQEGNTDFWDQIDIQTMNARSVLLYNRPGMEPIPHATISETGKNFDGIKDSSGHAEEFLRLLEFKDQDFSVYLGDEAIAEADPEILKQCDGIVSGSSNVPALAKLFKQWLENPEDAAVLSEIQKLKAEIAAMDKDYRVALWKYLQA